MTSTAEKRISQAEEGPVQEPVAEETFSRPLHGWKWVVAYGSILSPAFLFALDNTIVAAVQPSILEALGRVELLPWIGTGFALGSCAILAWGKAYGIFTVKWLFIFNILLFEIGSVICGAAPNMVAFIVGRVIAGVGGCGMYSGALTYIALLTSLAERPPYMAGVAVTWGLGSVLGPVSFYINLVIGAVFSPSYFFLLPDICLQPGKTLWQKLRIVDWIGTVIFFGGSVCFTMAITFSGLMYPWNSGPAIALWVMTGILLLGTIATTIWHPLVTKENRLIPAHFFRKPALVNLGLQMFLASGIMLSAVYYIPLYFAFATGDDVMQTGIRLLPYICLLVFTSIVSGIFMPKTGYYIPWYVVGSLVSAVGAALMVTVHAGTAAANIYGYTALVGFAGFYVAGGFAVMQALVPVEDLSNAVGFQSIAQVLGTVAFLSVSGNIFFNSAAGLITPLLPSDTPPEFIHDLIGGTSSHAFQSLSDELAGPVIVSIAESIRNVWIFNLAGSILSLVMTFFLGKAAEDF
ncbi:hypothetical protein DL767_002702 [Monosporascus sp. MG133]|nr:hypothetical protein DL767_002702 [Monosporascus sp. MG133]